MKWYACNGSMGQGLVIDESDGRNVAVAYDEKDAPLLAAAPEMRRVLARVSEFRPLIGNPIMDDVRAVLQEANARSHDPSDSEVSVGSIVGNRRTCRSCLHGVECSDNPKCGICRAAKHSPADRIIMDAYPECPLWVANAGSHRQEEG